ncbi:MAG: rod-binding protein, partial [Bdellovibrionales bacterium]|nr:rod-binding protein [Bdellovibrionales bacterium]
MKLSKAQQFKQTPQQQMQKLDNKLKQAAQMYEKQFLRQMVKAMRNTVSHSEMTKPGMAENIFREQLDEKYVDGWMKTGGTGFSEVIYKDLVNKFFPQLQKSPKKMARPKSITDRFKG